MITDPTRGNNVLDIMCTSFNDMLLEAGVTVPIYNNLGTESDHKVVYAAFKMPRVPDYTVETYSYYKESEDGVLKFGDWLHQVDWGSVLEATTPTEKVEALHILFEGAMETCFEYVTKKKKTSEPSWMTEDIRKLVRKCRKFFKKHGRNVVWRRLKRITSDRIKE